MSGDNQNDNKSFQNTPQAGTSQVVDNTEPTPITPPPTQDLSQPNPPPVGDTTSTTNQQPSQDVTIKSNASPFPSDIMQPTVTAPHAPKKYGGKKIIATIFGVLLLVGGVTAGVLLVQRQQQIAEEAASGKECQQSSSCILLESPGNSGTFNAPKRITHAFITAKDYHRFEPGQSDNGCYKVNIDNTYLSWEKYGPGPDCKDVSNIQVWLGEEELSPTITTTLTPTQPPDTTATPTEAQPTQPPQVSAKCLDVKAYDTQWNLLSQNDLNDLNSGDKVRFAVAGQASSGTFSKARFTVNGTSLGEATLKKPGSDEYYKEYTVPDGVTTFTVKGEVFHSELGWL